MFGTTNEERLAIALTLKKLAAFMEELGWEKRLADLDETEVTALVEVTIESFQEAMARIAASQPAQAPF